MFTLPLYDDNPTLTTPFVTRIIVVLCGAIFLWQQSLPPGLDDAVALSFGVVPAVLFGSIGLSPDLAVIPPWASLITSMFLHGGWMHILGNMLFLWIFGDNIEDAMGHGRFVLFYLLCGIAAALTQSMMAPDSHLPMIGASGAIAGVLGAYLLLFPWANVRVLLVIIVFVRTIDVPALVVLGLWFACQLISAEMTPAEAGGVAFWAHIGGFVCGALLLPLFKDSGIPLFGAKRSQAFHVGEIRVVRRGRVPTVIALDDPWRGAPGRRDPWRRDPWP